MLHFQYFHPPGNSHKRNGHRANMSRPNSSTTKQNLEKATDHDMTKRDSKSSYNCIDVTHLLHNLVIFSNLTVLQITIHKSVLKHYIGYKLCTCKFKFYSNFISAPAVHSKLQRQLKSSTVKKVPNFSNSENTSKIDTNNPKTDSQPSKYGSYLRSHNLDESKQISTSKKIFKLNLEYEIQSTDQLFFGCLLRYNFPLRTFREKISRNSCSETVITQMSSKFRKYVSQHFQLKYVRIYINP